MKLLKPSCIFLFLIISQTFAFPVQYNSNNEYFLNYTAGTVEIFVVVNQTTFLTNLPKNGFNITLPNIKNADVKREFAEKALKFNGQIQNEIAKGCDELDEPRFTIVLEIIGAVVIIGVTSYIAYVAYKHETYIRQTSNDLATLEQNERKWRQEEIEALEKLNERTTMISFFMEIQPEATATVKKVFGGEYDWSDYYQQNIFPSIKDHVIAVSSTVNRCTNDSLEILHQVISGNNLQNFTIFKFEILGSIKEDKYVEPVMKQNFIYYDEKWALIDGSQCWKKNGKEECTVKSLSFPSCNPHNVTSCKFVTESVDEDFFKFIEVEDTIQFVTKLPIFQIKNEQGVYSNFVVPTNGKVTITLAKMEELIIGNNTFCGKSDNPSKITYHTSYLIPNITEALRKQDEKMNNDAKEEDKHNEDIQNNPTTLKKIGDIICDFLLEHIIATIVFSFVLVISIFYCCCCYCKCFVKRF